MELYELPRYREGGRGDVEAADAAAPAASEQAKADTGRTAVVETEDGRKPDKPGPVGPRPRPPEGERQRPVTPSPLNRLIQRTPGKRAERVPVDEIPYGTWQSLADGTRDREDGLEDRAARYVATTNLIIVNRDFRVFQDMKARMSKLYGTMPGATAVINQAVEEWFSQILIETVISARQIEGSRHWSEEDYRKLLSEETLTGAVLARNLLYSSIKRTVSTRIGTFKKRQEAA